MEVLIGQEHIDWKGRELNADDGEVVASILENDQFSAALTYLLLDKNQMCDLGVAAIGRSLRTNRFLTTLRLNHNDIGIIWGSY